MNSILGSWAEEFRPHPVARSFHHTTATASAADPTTPTGHHLVVHRRGEEVHAVHRFSERRIGAPGIAHGGAVATVLDDLFGFLLYLTGTPAVTRQLEVRYDAPVILGTSYELAARVVRGDGRMLFVEAEMGEVGGALVATASALFLKVDVAHFVPDAPLPRSTSTDIRAVKQRRWRRAAGGASLPLTPDRCWLRLRPPDRPHLYLNRVAWVR